MNRSWIRLWIKESLRGSIRIDLTPAERSVWYELLLMAGDSRRPGIIEAGNKQPLPLEMIATWLVVPRELVESTIKKCVAEGRIELKEGFIKIVNWKKYQGGTNGALSSGEKKEIFSEKVKLTKEEYQKLCEKFGKDEADARIENLSLYIQSKGDKYRSHYATILNWERMEQDKTKKETGKKKKEPNRFIDGEFGHMVRR